MDVFFGTDDLERLESEEGYTAGFARPIVRAFRKVMRVIRSALDERDLYAMKSLHFEKLKGSRSNQHSLRLTDRWRLIVEIRESDPKNIIVVISIEDYH